MFLRENEQELSYLMSYRSSFIISLPPPAAVPVAAGAVQQVPDKNATSNLPSLRRRAVDGACRPG